MATSSAHKFIAYNREPRVHLQYEIWRNGKRQKVELPFIMGVMADLSGDGASELPIVEERKFVNIDVDNFDAVLKASKPHATFDVANLMPDGQKPGQERLRIDLIFESLDDFAPDAVARRVPGLDKFLEARAQLSTLLTRLEVGGPKAQKILESLLSDPERLKRWLPEDTQKTSS